MKPTFELWELKAGDLEKIKEIRKKAEDQWKRYLEAWKRRQNLNESPTK